MTGPTTVDARWADDSGYTVIEVNAEDAAGTAWLSLGGEAQATLTADQTVKLAHALLAIAAQSGIASQIGVKLIGSDHGKQTGWLYNADLLTEGNDQQ
jgi:hypothetical protein